MASPRVNSTSPKPVATAPKSEVATTSALSTSSIELVSVAGAPVATAAPVTTLALAAEIAQLQEKNQKLHEELGLAYDATANDPYLITTAAKNLAYFLSLGYAYSQETLDIEKRDALALSVNELQKRLDAKKSEKPSVAPSTSPRLLKLAAASATAAPVETSSVAVQAAVADVVSTASPTAVAPTPVASSEIKPAPSIRLGAR